MKEEKNTFFWVILIELENYLLSYYSIKSIQHNSFKVYKFLKTEVYTKYILISSTAKFTRLLYRKLILIKSFYFDFALWNWSSDIIQLFLSTNVFLFDVLTILIHHFVLFLSILSQKKKFYLKRKNNTQSSCMIFFLLILCRMDIYFKRFVSYESGITMNISNM